MNLSSTALVHTTERTFRERLAKSESVAVLKRLLRNGKGALGTTLLLLLVTISVSAPVIAAYDPVEIHMEDQLAPPCAKYWFGTDELGRDIFSRLVFGASISLQAGLLAVSLAAVVGVLTGVLAGYMGGWSSTIIMRLWDTLLAFPTIFLAIGIVMMLGPGRINAVIAIAVVNMPRFSRLVRATTLAVKEKDFVVAARAIGCSNWRIMFRTIFPNCISPLMVQMAISARSAILIEAGLSYLGLGSQPPAPSWGNMLQAAQGYLRQAPTYGLFPGIAITLLVIGLNYFADGLQDAIDPRRIHAAAKMG